MPIAQEFLADREGLAMDWLGFGVIPRRHVDLGQIVEARGIGRMFFPHGALVDVSRFDRKRHGLGEFAERLPGGLARDCSVRWHTPGAAGQRAWRRAPSLPEPGRGASRSLPSPINRTIAASSCFARASWRRPSGPSFSISASFSSASRAFVTRQSFLPKNLMSSGSSSARSLRADDQSPSCSYRAAV